MTINDKIFNSRAMDTDTKILLAFILKGNKRYKYISREYVANNLLFCSPAKVTKCFNNLCQMGLIRWVRKEGDKYKIVIVCQEAFNKFADIYDAKDIDEKCCVKDNYIQLLGEAEAQKPLIISHNEKGKKLQEAFDKVFNQFKKT